MDFEFTLAVVFPSRTPRIPLSREDRRRLHGASLRILDYRHKAGKRISREDITRIALFADDGKKEIVPCTRLVLGAGDGSEAGP